MLRTSEVGLVGNCEKGFVAICVDLNLISNVYYAEPFFIGCFKEMNINSCVIFTEMILYCWYKCVRTCFSDFTSFGVILYMLYSEDITLAIYFGVRYITCYLKDSSPLLSEICNSQHNSMPYSTLYFAKLLWQSN